VLAELATLGLDVLAVLLLKPFRVWEASHTAVIFVTHDIEEAVFLADRVIVLGGSPAHIAYETNVPLARPRRRDVPALFEVAATIATKLS